MAKPFGAVAGRAIRTAAGKADSRDKLMKAVRAACRRLAIDDDDRRALQLELTGKRSMADMDLADFGKLLDRLNAGWKGPMGHRRHIGKIRALWWTLYWLGAVDDAQDGALDAFVKRQAGVSSLRFLDHRKAPSVIEALKSWAAREGVDWPTEADLARRQVSDPDIDLPRLERHAVLDAIATKLRGELWFGYVSYCQKAMSLPCNHFTWSAIQLDAAIRMLGKKLRRMAEKARAE